MSDILPFQTQFRPVLPTVLGNVDYTEFERNVMRMDEILLESGVETRFIELALARWSEDQSLEQVDMAQRLRYQERSRRALRCIVVQQLLGEGVRATSLRLAQSALLQWFRGIDQLDVVRVPSKSELDRFTKWLPAEEMDAVITRLLQACHQPREDPSAPAPFDLETALEMETLWVDSTCLRANIHFPVDWVLLVDATRSLMSATGCIRRLGLCHRMEPPEEFLRRMNKLCIEMTQQGRRVDSRRGRKKVFRRMKKLMGIVRQHALRHRDLLEEKWEQTQWTRPQTDQVLDRIDRVLLQLPAAIDQAHERVIGERQVPNSEKILSLHEPDIHVIHRGKAGAKVEFGNVLFLGEQEQGLIMDWHLEKEVLGYDGHLLPGSLERLEKRLGPEGIQCVVGDRGFHSQANEELLEDRGIQSGLCPRDPRELKRRLKDPEFSSQQRRRAQTEGRIAILKNNFLGNPLRSKGFEHRNLSLRWSVLTHNLWVLARMETREEAAMRRQAAA